MQTTTTHISWPCRLKIGAKTKKGKIECGHTRSPMNWQLFERYFSRVSDPHVRIYGRPDDVLKAKDRVLATLDSRVIFESPLFARHPFHAFFSFQLRCAGKSCYHENGHFVHGPFVHYWPRWQQYQKNHGGHDDPYPFSRLESFQSDRKK